MTPWLSSFEPQPSHLLLSPSMPKLLKALVRERAAKPLHPTSRTLSAGQCPVRLTDTDQSCVLGELPLKEALIPGSLPMERSAPAALPACWTQTQGQFWSQDGDCNVAGELQLMLKNRVIFSLQDRFPSNLNFNGRSTLVQLRPREATVILNYR